MLIDYVLSQTSIILRVKIRSSSTGNGLTGLTGSSSGLIIGTIADVEATSTTYTAAASHIQTIATLGTYAAPSASDCRFAEVDSTNHPGIYEVQLANARFAVSSAKSLTVSITGASGSLDCDVTIPLRSVNPYAADNGLGAASLPTLPTANTWGEAAFLADLLGGRRNTAQAGTATTITLDASASSDSNAYVGDDIYLLSGTGGGIRGTGQRRTIVAYNTSTKVATVNRAWDTNPDSTSVFITLPQAKADLYLVDSLPAGYSTGTAQAGSSNTITLASTASSTNSIYNGWQIQRLDTGEWAIITGYVGSTNVATIRGTWFSGTNPTSSTMYVLNPPVSSNVEFTLGTASAGTAGYMGIDWGAVTNKTTANVLSGTTIGTLTTYTGNTPQTGDSFARIGATGSGLTSLAPASTALSTAQWTNTRAGLQDNLDAAVSSRSTYAGGAVASVTAPVTMTITQLLGSPRDLSSIADGSVQINDAFWAAIGAGVGKADASSGTQEIIETPAGTTLRTFTLTVAAGAPTSSVTKRA